MWITRSVNCILQFGLQKNRLIYLQLMKTKNFKIQNGIHCIGSIQGLHTSPFYSDIYKIDGEEDFKIRVMTSKIPVIVNFHADWCEPCHVLRPLLEKFAHDNPGKLHLAEIAVDEHAGLMHAFQVTAIPAVLAIQDGQVIDKFVGLVSDKEVGGFVKELLSSSNTTS